MAKFKADRKFIDLEKDVTYQAGEEFEMTLKRADELIANVKKNYGVDLVLTRTDADEEKEEKPKEVVDTKEKPKEKVVEGE